MQQSSIARVALVGTQGDVQQQLLLSKVQSWASALGLALAWHLAQLLALSSRWMLRHSA